MVLQSVLEGKRSPRTRGDGPAETDATIEGLKVLPARAGMARNWPRRGSLPNSVLPARAGMARGIAPLGRPNC